MITKIKYRWLRRTAVVLAAPPFIAVASILGTALYVSDFIEEAISVWRMK
jgi:hypothetical protein